MNNDKLYKNFFDCNIGLNCITSKEGLFIDINNNFLKLLEYDKDEIINKNIIDIIHQDDIILLKNNNYNIRVLTKKNGYIYLLWNVVYYDNYNYSNIINKHDDLLISKVIYELKIPLNVISGYIQLLENEKLNQITNKYISIINTNSNILLDLINNILNITNINIEYNIETLLIYDIIVECINENKNNIENENLKLIFNVENSENYIKINKYKFKEIINNLLTNSIKFNKLYGEIIIKCFIKNEKINISIQNTGIGISEKNINNLYKPFNKLNNTSFGAGLGLCIVKKILNIYNGVINCNSIENEFTIFTISFDYILPLNITTKNDLIIENNKFKVLYIEDNYNNALLISDIFNNKYKIKIDIALRGIYGINLIKKYKYNLILIDYLLPDINCDVIIKNLLENNLIDNLDNIVITTAYDENFMSEINKNLNIKYFLPKPINIKLLQSICEQILFTNLDHCVF